MSVPADNSRKNNANVVKRFKLSKKHFANVWLCVEKRTPYVNLQDVLKKKNPCNFIYYNDLIFSNYFESLAECNWNVHCDSPASWVASP